MDPLSAMAKNRFTLVLSHRRNVQFLHHLFGMNRVSHRWKRQKKLPYYSRNKSTLCEIRDMIINLSKQFHFNRDHNQYDGVYIFKNNKSQDGHTDVCLELKVSVNGEEEKAYRLTKPTAILFQSNEVIEEMIAEEVVAFSGN